jgi:uncharacterized membrane protein YfcA
MDLDVTKLILLLLVGAGAAFIQRVSGFGLGIFAMLFLPHVLPSAAAAAVSCLFSCGTSSYNTFKYRRHIPLKTVLPLLAAALAVIPVSVHFSARIPGHIFQAILGTVLIVLSLYFLFFQNRISLKPSVKNGLIAGAVGGTLNGLFSTGGPPIVLYLTGATTNKLEYFAAIQFYFALTNIYASILRIISGIVTWDLMLLVGVGLVGCLAGDFLGSKVFDRLDSRKLKQIIYIGMIISGVLMIL